jgi:di/tricarboxylate transporter
VLSALKPYLIIAVLIISMVLFISNRWRFDVVALIALALSVLLGAVPFHDVYTGLSNSAVITVACVMIISGAISDSGILNTLISRLGSVSKTPLLHIACLSLITAILSAFMNNVGALALMMPIAIKTSIDNQRSPSLILMPLALASAMGGLTTLIGTPPNMLISSYRQQYLHQPFSLFDFSHAGFGVALVGLIFIIFIGWRLLPKTERKNPQAEDIFQMEDYITELKIPEGSKFIGLSLAEFEEKIDADCQILGRIRKHKKQHKLSSQDLIELGDVFIVETASERIHELINHAQLEIYGEKWLPQETLHSDEIATLEAVIPPGCRLERRSWQTTRLRSRFHSNLVAIARAGKAFKERINHVNLQAGDVILLQGPSENLKALTHHLGLLPLVERGIKRQTRQRSYWPLAIFLLAILLTITTGVPVQVSFGAAILVMVLTRTLPIRSLYENIEWPIIILLAAMIPIGHALQTTGGTTLITDGLLKIATQLSPTWILAIVFIVTMTLSDFMNNAATTVVMAPIAISIARALGVHIDPFLMAVAIGASCSFLTPIGHQNNTLVMGPGGYRFSDYIRLGLPLEILITIAAIPLILWAWPLH